MLERLRVSPANVAHESQRVIALICCLSSSPGLVVIEQCFLAELGLYRKAAVPAAPLRGLGCLLCYTRRSALTRCTPGYWLTPAGGFGYACAHPGRGFSISLRSRTYLADSGGRSAKRGGPRRNSLCRAAVDEIPCEACSPAAGWGYHLSPAAREIERSSAAQR